LKYLIDRAQSQWDRVEKWCLEAARTALAPQPLDSDSAPNRPNAIAENGLALEGGWTEIPAAFGMNDAEIGRLG
jgi:hypothetical protein